jgi:LDH2 family malate/lactate/ureidoglycolate dehydrogenase
MTSTVFISAAALHDRVEAIFLNAGLHPVQARSLSSVIVDAERDACKSHGIYRIEGVLRSIRAGKVAATALPELLPNDGSAVLKVTANGGFANSAFDLALPDFVARTRQFGIAALAINDCAHLTALWAEVEALTSEGLAALAMCPSYATVAPAGGNKPLLGTNPLAFGWPRPSGQPYVFDFATSVAARGEIEIYKRAGKQLPAGWAIDAAGEATTDPEAALAGAMLPFGGHKGSAIATMIELLAGALIGDRTSPEVLEFLGTTTLAPVHGELIIAFSPETFAAGRAGNPALRAEALFDAIVGQGARLPSQRRFSARSKAMTEGIELSQTEMRQLEDMATRHLC